mmetsp:Transcript_2254/g.6639  ORF Transcript_2254/g.6639 Transcript_2254/m.6639 type:complete len:233 (-) Transcript_2254:826-1524(-)
MPLPNTSPLSTVTALPRALLVSPGTSKESSMMLLWFCAGVQWKTTSGWKLTPSLVSSASAIILRTNFTHTSKLTTSLVSAPCNDAMSSTRWRGRASQHEKGGAHANLKVPSPLSFKTMAEYQNPSPFQRVFTWSPTLKAVCGRLCPGKPAPCTRSSSTRRKAKLSGVKSPRSCSALHWSNFSNCFSRACAFLWSSYSPDGTCRPHSAHFLFEKDFWGRGPEDDEEEPDEPPA